MPSDLLTRLSALHDRLSQSVAARTSSRWTKITNWLTRRSVSILTPFSYLLHVKPLPGWTNGPLALIGAAFWAFALFYR